MRVKALFLFFFLSMLTAFSQRKDLTTSVPTPNAASLGTFWEMPVSYFTGVPNINIPIYEVKGNKIGLSIALAYHAGGLKPDVHPGWVGNGWSLMAGGVITRKVNGNIDEYYKTFSGKAGFYYNYSNLNNGTWSSSATLSNPNPSYTNVSGVPGQQTFDSDTEPDEFIFNFGGYSGSFYLDQTGNWRVQCDKPLKVIFDPQDFIIPFVNNIFNLNISININQTFGRFTILDEFGNKYIFGSKDANNTAIEYSDNMVPLANPGRGATLTATSWYLTKVSSADESEYIDLTYERGPLTSSMGYARSNTAVDASGGGFMTLNPPCSYSTNSFLGINGSVIFPVYLTSISMPSKNLLVDFREKSKTDELLYKWNGSNQGAYAKVWQDAGELGNSGTDPEFPSFYLNMTNGSVIPYFLNNTPSAVRWERFIWLKLDAISIKNSADNSLIKRFEFSYNNNINKRLQLGGFQLKNKINQLVGNYTFNYNNTSLPDYLTIYGDHWGFNNYVNNGSTNNNLLPGAGGSSSLDYLSLRSPEQTGSQVQAELLTTITYPTGGNITFEYEPNTFAQVVDRTVGNGVDPVAATGIAGGVRIKKITANNNLGNAQSRTFYYVNNYTAGSNPNNLPSSGILDSKPQYSFNCTGIDNYGLTVYYQSVATHPVIPLTTNSSGTYIGYSKVVEVLSDGSYSIYEYSNHDNVLYRDQACINSHNKWALGYSPVASCAYKRGKLIRKTDKDNTGNTTAEKIIEYGNVGVATPINAVYIYGFNVCPSSGSSRAVLTRVAYQNSAQSFLPLRETTSTYPLAVAGSPVTKTVTYSYDSYKNLNTEEITDSKGIVYKDIYQYPYHFSGPQPENPYQYMVEMNNVSTVVQKQSLVGDQMKTGEINTFKILGDKRVYPTRTYQYQNATVIPYTSVSSTTYGNGGDLVMDSRFKLENEMYYDATGNLSTLSAKNGSIAFLWNYNGQLPVAKVNNAINIYESGVANNVPVQLGFYMYMNGNPPTSSSTYTINVLRPGDVTVTLAYINPYVPGNNSTNVNVVLTGANFSATGSICAKTLYYTTGCNNNVYTFSNVPAGVYTIQSTVTSFVGFSNYYGYSVSVSYPSFKYAIINGSSSVAYTSFETEDYGNWKNINNNNKIYTLAFTGAYYYNLSGQTISSNNLESTQKYVLSYWSKGGSCAVSGSVATRTGRTVGGWTYYEHLVTGVSIINVSGTVFIDELRLYPEKAHMITYTYDPIYGLTSECDTNNNVIYYQYDYFGRLYLVKDVDGNILKKICYNYAGINIPCD